MGRDERPKLPTRSGPVGRHGTGDPAAFALHDPAGLDLDRYGLGDVRTLADWTEYSGLDYKNLSVRTPWPENDPESS